MITIDLTSSPLPIDLRDNRFTTSLDFSVLFSAKKAVTVQELNPDTGELETFNLEPAIFYTPLGDYNSDYDYSQQGGDILFLWDEDTDLFINVHIEESLDFPNIDDFVDPFYSDGDAFDADVNAYTDALLNWRSNLGQMTSLQLTIEDVVTITSDQPVSLSDIGRISDLFEGDTVVNGTPFDDTLRGDADENGNGHDTVSGGDGNDLLLGDGGNDILNGNDGNDELRGDRGDDDLRGDDGDDLLEGGDGNDLLEGGDGNDLLGGGDGNDILRGDSGDDELSGGAKGDELLGGDGNDLLNGGDDNDLLSGGEDDDELNGNNGSDIFKGIDAKLGLLDGEYGTNHIDGGDYLDLSTVDEVHFRDSKSQYLFAVNPFEGGTENKSFAAIKVFPAAAGDQTDTIINWNILRFGDGRTIFESELAGKGGFWFGVWAINGAFSKISEYVGELGRFQDENGDPKFGKILAWFEYAEKAFAALDTVSFASDAKEQVERLSIFAAKQVVFPIIDQASEKLNDLVDGLPAPNSQKSQWKDDISDAANDLKFRTNEIVIDAIGAAWDGLGVPDDATWTDIWQQIVSAYQELENSDENDLFEFDEQQRFDPEIQSPPPVPADDGSPGSEPPVMTPLSDYEGDSSDEFIIGGNANQTIYAKAGNDVVHAGDGNDLIIAGEGSGNDYYDGGAGSDTISFASAANPITVNLLLGIAFGDDVDLDQLVGFENVIGGSGADTLLGDTNANELVGGPGDDTISSGGGNDILSGGIGDDLIQIGLHAAVVDGGEGTDTLDVAGFFHSFLITDPNGDGLRELRSNFQTNSGFSVVFEGIEQIRFIDGIYDVGADEFTPDPTAVSFETNLLHPDGEPVDLGEINLGDNISALNPLGHWSTLFSIEGDHLVYTGQAPSNQQLDVEFVIALEDGSYSTLTIPVFVGQTINDPIVGTPDPDVIDGTALDDDIHALDSDDTINASAGSDLIDGDQGHDTVVYSGPRADYTQDLQNNGTITVEKPGGGTDSLTNVERIDFTDGDYVYDLTSPNTGFGYRIYQASFGRTPDEGGVRFWIGNLDNFDQQGWSDYEKEQFLASQFIQSDEFRDLYGANPSNFEYIDAMYQNVLFRLPDQAGYDFWVGGMENDGLTREDILIAFTKSDENVNNNSQNLDDGVWVV